MIRRFFFWLQQKQGMGIAFKGARAYLSSALRFIDWDTNPMDLMPKAYRKRLEQAFDKNSIVKKQPKIAMTMKLARHYIDKWCKHSYAKQGQTPFMQRSKEEQRVHLLGTALLTYAITALRAGNVLMGTSDNREALCLHIEDIFEYKKANKIPLLFIINNRSKTSKVPIITPVPFNPTSNKALCAATRLLSLVEHRLCVENAKPSDYLFINPSSKKPLRTGVFNKEVQKFAKELCSKQGLSPSIAKLYSAKSLRKFVSSEMKDEKCSPQQIAQQLGHNTLDSQLSYICNDYTKKKPFVAHLYGRLN